MHLDFWKGTSIDVKPFPAIMEGACKKSAASDDQKPITGEKREMCSIDVCFFGHMQLNVLNPLKFCVFVFYPVLSVAANV